MLHDENIQQRPYGERVVDPEREGLWLHLMPSQAEVLASGYVPGSVKSVLRELLDYELEDLKRADRPVLTEPKRRRVR